MKPFEPTAAALLLATVVGLGLFLLALFHRRRDWYGLLPLLVTLALLPIIQTYLAVACRWHVGSGLMMSPGSVAFFTGSLFVVLLVCMSRDPIRLRKLCTALIVGNLVCFLWVTVMIVTIGLHTAQAMDGTSVEPATSYLLRWEVPVIMATGLGVQMIDIGLIVLAYERVTSWSRLGRLGPALFWLQLWVAMAAILALDSVLFVAAQWGVAAAGGRPFDYPTEVLAAVVGKAVAAAVLTVIVSVYIHFISRNDEDIRQFIRSKPRATLLELRALYTYLLTGGGFGRVLEAFGFDRDTELYTAQFADSQLENDLDTTFRNDTPTSVLFVGINDLDCLVARHSAADDPADAARVRADIVRRVSAVLRRVCPSAPNGFPCRYGRDTFAVILPNTGRSEALRKGRAIASVVQESVSVNGVPGTDPEFARVSVGLCTAVRGDSQLSPEPVIERAKLACRAAREGGGVQAWQGPVQALGSAGGDLLAARPGVDTSRAELLIQLLMKSADLSAASLSHALQLDLAATGGDRAVLDTHLAVLAEHARDGSLGAAARAGILETLAAHGYKGLPDLALEMLGRGPGPLDRVLAYACGTCGPRWNETARADVASRLAELVRAAADGPDGERVEVVLENLRALAVLDVPTCLTAAATVLDQFPPHRLPAAVDVLLAAFPRGARVEPPPPFTRLLDDLWARYVKGKDDSLDNRPGVLARVLWLKVRVGRDAQGCWAELFGRPVAGPTAFLFVGLPLDGFTYETQLRPIFGAALAWLAENRDNHGLAKLLGRLSDPDCAEHMVHLPDLVRSTFCTPAE